MTLQIKKTFFVISIVILTLFTSIVHANGIEVKTSTGNSLDRQELKVKIAECNVPTECGDVEALLTNADSTMVDAHTRVIVSDLPAETVADELKKLNLQSVENTDPTQSTFGFFEIDKTEAELQNANRERRLEKIQAVIFTTLQTGVGTLSLLYISKTPIEPTIAMTIVGGMTSLYYNWDIERWDDFQRWGRNMIAKGLGKVGIQNWQQKKWFNTVGKTIAGTAARVGFISLFVGISLWNNFSTDFLTFNTLFRVSLATLIGTLTSQPYENVFGDWMENGHRSISQPIIHLLYRIRILIAAGVTPLIYAGNELGYAGALGLFAGGITLMVYDRVHNIEQKIDLKIESTKEKTKGFIGRTVEKIKCHSWLRKKAN